MNCPEDGFPLEFISGNYRTGVVAPDGVQEMLYGEGWQCPRCHTVYDESELEELIAEGNDPEFVRPA